jgi:ubiquinone/menaquinone biosynthesis C-methylase UbiE
MGDGPDPADSAPSQDRVTVAWDEDRAAWWLAGAEEREKQLQPVSAALFARAALQPGEHVLDVGVGSGRPAGRHGRRFNPADR